MSTRTVTWTVDTWENRASAAYTPVNTHINNVVIDAYGRRSDSPTFGRCSPRRPYKTEETDEATYLMYDDDTNGAVPIIRITEEEEDQNADA